MTLPFRVQAGVWSCVVFSFWGVVEYYGFETRYASFSPDPYQLAQQQARFEVVRSTLRSGQVIGYITDLEPGSTGATAAYAGAQYSLAPVALKPGADAPTVLGNFSKPADFVAIAQQHGLRVEKDFGQGVLLFRKAAE